MKKTRYLILSVLLTGLFFVPPLPAQSSPGQVWVAPHTLPTGQVIPGYWRPPFRKGYYWVKGKEDKEGNWIPGHWKPVGRAPKDKVWVPGYWNGAIFVDGYWRPVSRSGHTWVGPGWYGGRWRDGHWRAYKGGKPFRVRFPK